MNMIAKTKILPRYAETDQMGIIHHSVYAVWYEQARTDYFNRIEFLEEEYILLFCLMNIVPVAVFDHDEIDNIIKLSRLLYYLDSINEFINTSH